MKSNTHLSEAKEFLSFINKSFTPFHVVQTTIELLESAGFLPIEENREWPKILPGEKYYFTRNGTGIIAFTTGAQFKPINGLRIVGAHTDSPNFSLKPRTFSRNSKYERVGVQCYGAGLWHTWFDRDLTVGGRVILDRKNSKPVLIRVNKPILRIPNIAIHLCPQSERENFAPNKEKHLVPIISLKIEESCNGAKTKVSEKHCIPLLRAVADAAGCKEEEILDYDLSLFDYQDAAIGGVNDEFIFASRLDNLISCYCAIKALTECQKNENEGMANVICFFDHEEVGSVSAQGAGSTLLPDLIGHLTGNQVSRSTLVANSFLLSIDGAHAVHPNYSEKHDDSHQPTLNGGPVIKYNANTRYATNGHTGAIVKSLAKIVSVPIQEFCVKNDSTCGSTIGPMISTLTGIKTADIGNSMLSMHSIREMCGVTDVTYLIDLIKSLFENYEN